MFLMVFSLKRTLLTNKVITGENGGRSRDRRDMFKQRQDSENLIKTIKESTVPNDEVFHKISDIALDLAQLVVPSRSGMLIGMETAPDSNRAVLDPRSAAAIERMCDKLSDSRLSPMERFELDGALRDQLVRGALLLKGSRLGEDAKATLGNLATALTFHWFKHNANPLPASIREPYELGDKFLHIKKVVAGLPVEPRALTESLLEYSDAWNRPEERSAGFEALRGSMKDHKLSHDQELQVLKCLALASGNVNVRYFAIKELFRALNPADRGETIEKILNVSYGHGNRSPFLPHYLEYLSEEVTKHQGAQSGSEALLPILNQLGELARQNIELPKNPGSFVYDALYAVKNEIGVNENITQVAQQLRNLVAQEKGVESSEYRKYVRDFNLEAPTVWESVKDFFGWA